MLEGETSMEKHKQGRDLGDARGASMGGNFKYVVREGSTEHQWTKALREVRECVRK